VTFTATYFRFKWNMNYRGSYFPSMHPFLRPHGTATVNLLHNEELCVPVWLSGATSPVAAERLIILKFFHITFPTALRGMFT
jgi:hypothetical protein